MTFSVLNTVRLPFIASLGLLGASAIAQSLLEVRPPGSQGMANEMRDTTAPASLREAPELPPPTAHRSRQAVLVAYKSKVLMLWATPNSVQKSFLLHLG